MSNGTPLTSRHQELRTQKKNHKNKLETMKEGAARPVRQSHGGLTISTTYTRAKDRTDKLKDWERRTAGRTLPQIARRALTFSQAGPTATKAGLNEKKALPFARLDAGAALDE